MHELTLLIGLFSIIGVFILAIGLINQRTRYKLLLEEKTGLCVKCNKAINVFATAAQYLCNDCLNKREIK